MDMAKLSAVLHLFLIYSTFPHIGCERFNVVRFPDSPCPGEFDCLTLQQYAANPSHSSNITLELQPGDHHLDSLLFMLNIHSLEIRAISTASVLCSQSAYFSFSHLQQITISGVTFSDCKMNLMFITNATFLRSSFMKMIGYRCCTILKLRWTLLQMNHCIFSNNNTANNAQAIVSYNGNMYILSSNFSGFVMIRPGHGGALYTSGTDVTIIHSYFSDNVVFGIGYGGAAVYIHQGIATLIDSYFGSNIASGAGGAVFVFGGQLNIDNSYFGNNRANAIGGTVYVSGGDLNVINTYFINSTALSNGGAAYIFNGELNVRNSHFANNNAGRLGGAAIYIHGGKVAIVNSTFEDNIAMGPGGSCCYSLWKGIKYY